MTLRRAMPPLIFTNAIGRISPGYALALIAVWFCVGAPLARASDTLVMPYTCEMASGRPMLTASPQHGHAIVGRHEERSFTACSPVDRDQCRTWVLHRFVMDCEGAAVPWMVVAANSLAPNRQGLKPAIQNGRMILPMPLAWTLRPDDPCARGPTYDPRWNYGPLGRPCAEQRGGNPQAYGPPATVELPPGFAPLYQFDAVIVADRATASGTGGGYGQQPLPPKDDATSKDCYGNSCAFKGRDATGPSLADARAAEGFRVREPEPMKGTLESRGSIAGAKPTGTTPARKFADSTPNPITPASPAANNPARAQSASSSPGGALTPVPPDTAPSPASSPSPSATQAATPSAPVVLNRAAAAPATPPTPSPPARTEAVPERPPAPVAPLPAAQAAAATPANVEQSSNSSQTVTASKTDPIAALSADRMDATRPVKLYRSQGLAFATAAAIATTLAALAFIGSWLWRRSTPSSAASPINANAFRTTGPDFGSFALDSHRLDGVSQTAHPTTSASLAIVPVVAGGTGEPRQPSPDFALLPEGFLAPVLADHPHASAISTSPASTLPGPDHIPHTREEALQILGMGLGSHASTTAMKKIVDGLRLAWHPDHAGSDDERPARELAIRQINAAWDILAGKRIGEAGAVIPERW